MRPHRRQVHRVRPGDRVGGPGPAGEAGVQAPAVQQPVQGLLEADDRADPGRVFPQVVGAGERGARAQRREPGAALPDLRSLEQRLDIPGRAQLLLLPRAHGPLPRRLRLGGAARDRGALAAARSAGPALPARGPAARPRRRRLCQAARPAGHRLAARRPGAPPPAHLRIHPALPPHGLLRYLLLVGRMPNIFTVGTFQSLPCSIHHSLLRASTNKIFFMVASASFYK